MDRFVFKRTTVPTYEENDTLPHVTFQFGEKSPKSHKKAKKHRKEQRKMRRDIDCLSKEVKQLQRKSKISGTTIPMDSLFYRERGDGW